tara:strand:- start:2119 stop:2832 length:714 start_codon:yes stop_codon:yes gene_type:complete
MVMNKGVALNEAKSVVMNFVESLNFKVPLDYKIRETWRELYGVNGTGGGGFHSALSEHDRGLVTISSNNHRSKSALERTLKHEVLGHFLINTYSPQEKRVVIENIIAAEYSQSLSNQWNKVKTIYPDITKSIQAEEVYAGVAEGVDVWAANDKVIEKPLSKRSYLLSGAEVSPSDLENDILSRIADLKNGLLKQQTFPSNDVHSSQFILNNLEHRASEWRDNNHISKTKPSSPTPSI